MEFQLIFSEQAKEKLLELETDKSKKGLLKQLRKALGLMETNLKHPSLNTHKFNALQCKLGDKGQLDLTYSGLSVQRTSKRTLLKSVLFDESD